MSGFAHNVPSGPTTMSEILRARDDIKADSFFGCYAYATQSGFRTFELSVGKKFWADTETKWLFGIDYGRTDPRALREIAKKENANVRIYDAKFVVDRAGFVPRRDFHPKVAMMEKVGAGHQAMVLGLGNFSHNGLRRSVEAGCSIIHRKAASIGKYITPVRDIFNSIWDDACPLSDVVDDYEASLVEFIKSKDATKAATKPVKRAGFWIEAGYVTKNRGKDKPGNQIFAPNGFREFFGLKKTAGGTTKIGELVFRTDAGPLVKKNYRENDNGMEKLGLPSPEEHGFGVYDGKVLVFEPQGKKFLLRAVEVEYFEMTYGHRISNIQRMNGGRRFGELI